MASDNVFKGFVACPNCGFVVTRFGDVPFRQCDKCNTTFQDSSRTSKSQDNIEEIFSYLSSDNLESSFHDNSNRTSLTSHKNGSSPSPTRTTEPLDVGNDGMLRNWTSSGMQSESSSGRPRNGGKNFPIYKQITKSRHAKDDKNHRNCTIDFMGSPIQERCHERSSSTMPEVPASAGAAENLDGLYDKTNCSSTGDHVGSPSREISHRTLLGGSEHSVAMSHINKASDVKDHAFSSNQTSDFVGSPTMGSSHGAFPLRGFVSRRRQRPSTILNMGVEKVDTCSVYSEMSASFQEQLQERSVASQSSSRSSSIFTFEREINNDDYDDFLSEHNSIGSETDTSFAGESSRSSSKYTPSVTPGNHEATPKKDAFYSHLTIPHYPSELPWRSRGTLVKDAQLLKPTETVSCCLRCEAEGYHSSVEYSALNPLCAHNHRKEGKVELQQKKENSQRCYRPVLGGINFLFCYKCLVVLQMPSHFKFSRKKTNKLRCGGCEDIISYSVINGIHIAPRDYSPGETYSTGKDARKKTCSSSTNGVPLG